MHSPWKQTGLKRYSKTLQRDERVSCFVCVHIYVCVCKWLPQRVVMPCVMFCCVFWGPRYNVNFRQDQRKQVWSEQSRLSSEDLSFLLVLLHRPVSREWEHEIKSTETKTQASDFISEMWICHICLIIISLHFPFCLIFILNVWIMKRPKTSKTNSTFVLMNLSVSSIKKN